MWRNRKTQFPQVVALIAFGLLCVVLAILYQVLQRPGQAPRGQFLTGLEYSNDEFLDSGGNWRRFTLPGAAFTWESGSGALMGEVLIDRGFVTTTALGQRGSVVVTADVRQVRRDFNTQTTVGVMCRADRNGNGYYFLLSGSGRVSIQKAVAGVADLIPVTEWVYTPLANPIGTTNRLTGACAGDTLLLYVNYGFVLQGQDSTYRIGEAGVALAGVGLPSETNSASPFSKVGVAFDRVVISEALQIGR